MNIKQLNYTLIYPQILVAAVKFFLGNDEADVESCFLEQEILPSLFSTGWF